MDWFTTYCFSCYWILAIVTKVYKPRLSGCVIKFINKIIKSESVTNIYRNPKTSQSSFIICESSTAIWVYVATILVVLYKMSTNSNKVCNTIIFSCGFKFNEIDINSKSAMYKKDACTCSILHYIYLQVTLLVLFYFYITAPPLPCICWGLWSLVALSSLFSEQGTQLLNAGKILYYHLLVEIG